MNVLVIGAGVYVCGRGTAGHGTILPALFPLVESGKITRLFVAVMGTAGEKTLKEKINELNQFTGANILPTIVNLSQESLRDIVTQYKIHVAYVCTPDHTHFEITKTLLSENVHVQVVKPLAPTVKECKELATLQEKKQLLGSVEYHKRFDRSNKILRSAVLSKEVGDPLYFIVEYSQRKIVPEVYFKSWAEHSNPFQYLGVHYADVIAWATDYRANVVKISAMGQKQQLKNNTKLDTYDNVNVTAEYRYDGKPFTAHYFINWIDPKNTTAMSDQRIKVIGTKGRMECDQKDRGVFKVTDDSPNEVINPDFCRPYLIERQGIKKNWNYEGYGIESVSSFINDVIDYQDKKITWADWENKRATFKQSIPIAGFVEAVESSLRRNGAWVELGE